MQVEVIKSYDAFEALKTNWDDLYRKDPEAQFFLSWIWLSRVFRDHPHQWQVLAVKADSADGGYLGFFPIRLKTIWSKSRRIFRNEIHMAGRLSWAQYTGFLCHPDREEDVAASLAWQLRRMHWARMSLKYFHGSEQRRALFLKQFSDQIFETAHHSLTINKGSTNNLICPCIDLPEDHETHLQSQLSSNTRQKVRRFLRKLDKSDELRITAANADTVQRGLDILVDLWIKKWTDSKGRRVEELAQTYRRILQNSFECDALYLPVLWRGDEPLGALGNLVDWQKRRLFFIVSSRDESVREPFVGWILHAHSIRWAIENGIKIYDFCHGDEAYKYSYGATGRRVGYTTISTRSGTNLHGILDPSCIDDVMTETMRFLKKDRLREAHIACQQVRDAALRSKRQDIPPFY